MEFWKFGYEAILGDQNSSVLDQQNNQCHKFLKTVYYHMQSRRNFFQGDSATLLAIGGGFQ
jgi:hypothetical protein